MTDRIIVDTGPLIALLDSDSNLHERTVKIWKAVGLPALTCEAVLTEATFLLQRDQLQPDALYELLHCGALKIGIALSEHSQDIRALMKRYRNIPMSLADASLVRLSELNPRHRLFTFDSDFQIYRKHGNKVIPVLSVR